MDRKAILAEVKKYYDVRELVSPAMFAKHGDNSWFVFSIEFLTSLLELRLLIGVPATCNNWHYVKKGEGVIYTQRGWRDNLSQIVKDKTKLKTLYVSGHCTAGAADQTFEGIDAEDVRLKALANHDNFTYKMRFEHMKKDANGIYQPLSWVHMDVLYFEKNPKVYLFNV